MADDEAIPFASLGAGAVAVVFSPLPRGSAEGVFAFVIPNEAEGSSLSSCLCRAGGAGRRISVGAGSPTTTGVAGLSLPFT